MKFPYPRIGTGSCSGMAWFVMDERSYVTFGTSIRHVENVGCYWSGNGSYACTAEEFYVFLINAGYIENGKLCNLTLE